MGIDVKDLSPAAQRQVLRKLMESNRNRAGAKIWGSGAALESEEGKHASEDKPRQKVAKYGNKKVEVDGILFDSKREARRYLDLRAMEIAGQIQNLRLQVKYELIPSQRIDGKVVERGCEYVADFVYEENGQTVVEDTKGHRTKDYIIKRKLMLYVHGIRIREV